MMVEQPLAVGNVLRNLDSATSKLSEIGGKSKISKQEIQDLVKTIDKANAGLDPTFLQGKKLAPEQMNASIDRALAALALFQRGATQRNVEQAITSLFDSMQNTLKAFDKNLRNLKKHKIDRKVEKTEGNDAGDQERKEGRS